MKLVLSLCKLISKAMESHDLQKDFIKDISLSTIWKCILKILNFTHSRRKTILDLERTPSFEKQSIRFFFFFLKTSSIWRSCPLSIGWMDGLLGFRPWGNWESLRAHALSWTESFFFCFGFLIFFFNFFFFFVNEKCKQEIQTFSW